MPVSHCGDSGYADTKSVVNNVVINSSLLQGATWVTDTDTNSCVVTGGQPSSGEVTYRSKTTATDGIVLGLSAGRKGSVDVANIFNGILAGGDSGYPPAMPWIACNKRNTAYYPTDLNFMFCGKFVKEKKDYHACFAQGSKDNWYMASRDLTGICHGNHGLSGFDVVPTHKV